MHFLSSIGMAADTSGRAFAEIAWVYGKDVIGILTGTALTGIPFIRTAFTGIPSSIGNTVCSSKGPLPPSSEEDTEFLDLNGTSDLTCETRRR